MNEELGLQDVQSVKFREEVRSRVRNRTHRIVRVLTLPLAKRPVGLGELHVVHLPVTFIEQRRLRVDQAGSGTEENAKYGKTPRHAIYVRCSPK